ncbi:Beta-lactamase class C-like and penicillin binding proteins (PBPs) superfamily [Olavius sp. associated proteobacterium Delta 1]|nr:Beta-lactamase class C-like and penicillin binding proteins (PBPs) superfamily [Olavius sp. associated proteobacterium Delta 1]
MILRNRIASLIILIAILVLAGCSGAPVKPDQIIPGNYDYAKEYLTWLTHKEMKRNKVMGLSIAIVDDQKIVWAQGFGYADAQNEIPATSETVYRIGSISKLFTVMAAMKLAEQGKIQIDRPLKNYLPQFSIRTRFPDSGPITPRTIMTHHSGLPSSLAKGMWSSEPPAKLLDRLKDEYTAYPTNYVLAYSNTGLALLGLMIEQVSTTDFCEYVEQSILSPIGMQQSSFKRTPVVEGLLSKGYRNGKEIDQVPLRDVSAGAMYSNVNDLILFMQMVFAGGDIGGRQVLRRETMEEMLRPQNQDIPLESPNPVGLGWFLKIFNLSEGIGKVLVAGHDGGTPLFRTSLVILPEIKLGVVVLTNSTEGRKILKTVTREALKFALEAKTGKSVNLQEEAIAPPDKVAAEEIMNSLVGRYATLSSLGSIERKGQNLSAKFEDYKFRLIPSSDGKFGVERKDLGIFPVKKIGGLELSRVQVSPANIDGRQLLSIRYNNSLWFYAEKINPSPLPNTWQNMLGRYQIINPDPKGSPQDMILSSEEDVLVLRYKNPLWHPGEAKHYLIPRSDTEALTLGIGRSSGETMRMFEIDGETGLLIWGYQMKKIN